MPFENSTATDTKDLLQKLVIFLVAHGWTSDRSAIEGAGWTASLHKGAVYVHLRAHFNETPQFLNGIGGDPGYSIGLYLGTGFSGGSAWNSQLAGAPIQSNDVTSVRGAIMTLTAGAIGNYYFFTDATNDNVVVIVQKSSGIYAHMGWGNSLLKVGTWTGGPYFFGSSAGFWGHLASAGEYGHDLTAQCMGTAGDHFGGCCTFVRAAVDAFDGWVSIGPDTLAGNPAFGYCGKLGVSSVGGPSSGNFTSDRIPTYVQNGNWANPGGFQTGLTSSIDGRANLLPCLLWAQRDGSGPGYSPLGSIPNCFVCSGVGQGFSPASDYALGPDTYTLFPYFAVKKTV